MTSLDRWKVVFVRQERSVEVVPPPVGVGGYREVGRWTLLGLVSTPVKIFLAERDL